MYIEVYIDTYCLCKYKYICIYMYVRRGRASKAEEAHQQQPRTAWELRFGEHAHSNNNCGAAPTKVRGFTKSTWLKNLLKTKTCGRTSQRTASTMQAHTLGHMCWETESFQSNKIMREPQNSLALRVPLLHRRRSHKNHLKTASPDDVSSVARHVVKRGCFALLHTYFVIMYIHTRRTLHMNWLNNCVYIYIEI